MNQASLESQKEGGGRVELWTGNDLLRTFFPLPSLVDGNTLSS